MGEEIQVPPCAKCGHTDSTIEYKQIVTPGDVYAVDPELLWAQCCRSRASRIRAPKSPSAGRQTQNRRPYEHAPLSTDSRCAG